MRKAKWFRRAAAIVLMLLMILSLAGCAGASGKKNSSQQTTSQAAVSAQKTTDQKETEARTTGSQTENQNSGKRDAGASEDADAEDEDIDEDGSYSSKEEVAAYLHLYGHLPENYLTKNEAKDLGWDSSKGNLWEVAPGKSIGGDKFGNREGLLPDEKGRKYYECDIDYNGGRRNSKRIIYSNDGLIYYTEDHYASFELLYGEE